MKKLEDLFKHQLKDLYSAENQLLKALPKMQKAAYDTKLKKAFEDHLEETKNHKIRLEEVCKELDIKPTGENCKAMKGLIEEAQGMIDEKADREVKDAGLIAEAQRVEHYEISGYGTLVRYAKELGHTKIASKLQKTLDEEHKADATLNEMAENRLNVKAI
jgi:ferritin-like metal-binding protein YciE